MFEIVEKESSGTMIKVIGVGGAGGNAVDHMIREGVKGVDFISANTDAQALKRSLAPVKVQLGDTGLGAGSKPEAGRAAAQESRDDIAAVLEGAHMVFITGGMGGGTGTGAAPVVAEIAKEMGILTVAVVTKPFDFENRIRVAESGVEELTRHVDSLIVVLNDKLLDVYGDDAGFEECFRSADNVLRSAVGGIAEIINVPGLVNVDFQDVRTAMAEMGRAMMGSAEASGLDRARIAAEQAAVSPLLEGTDGVRKMSKSYGNYIGLTDAPKDMFGKTMSIPDEMIGKYYRLASSLTPAEVDKIDAALADGSADPYELKRALGRDLCDTYHGAGAGDEAQAEFDRVFKEGQLADFPEKHVELTVNDEGQIYLAGLLKDLGLSASAGQARRDIDGGGVKINGKAVAPKSYNIDPSALKLGDTLSVGKRKGFKLI